MLKVVTQDKTTKLEIKEYFYKEDDGVFSIVEGESRLILGKYKSKERAKEVFEEMISHEERQIGLFSQLINKSYMVYTKTYWMPEE